MFKNMLKRTWLSTVRKPSKTIILTLILFVMANMILATIIIKSAVAEATTNAKESLSGIVYLQADMEKLRASTQVESTPGGGQRMRIMRPYILLSNAAALADSEYVKDFTYSYTATANATDFILVENDNSQMMDQLRGFQGQSGGMFRQNADGVPVQILRGDTSIQGVNAFAFIPAVQNGEMKLVGGEAFDENSTGVTISADLAAENDLSVGDQITLTTVANETTKTLTIAAIYETTSENFDANTIYMPVNLAVEFATESISEEDIAANNFAVENIRYYLTNAEYKDQFLAESATKYPTMPDDNLTLDIDTSAYDRSVGPIESVGNFATTIMWVVILASVVIITLVITINVKDRRYEMGVLLSLGAKKSNIVGQVLLELILVGTLAFALATTTGSLIASAMGDGLLSQQLASDQVSEEQNFGRGTSANTRGGPQGAMQLPGIFQSSQANSDIEPISEININASPSDYAILFIAGYLIIIVSLVIPTANVLRYQPKTILTGKE